MFVILSVISVILQDGYSALMLAANFGHAECVRVLVEAGADVNSESRVSACVIACLMDG